MYFVRTGALFLLIILLNCSLTVKSCDVFRKVNVNLYDDPLSVEKIDVINVEISNLCRNAIKNLENLQTIELISNDLQGIEPGAFNNIPSIRNIIIKKNKLHNIDDGVFNNLTMRKLDLSSNGIVKISENAFADTPKLEVLILNYNKIKTIHPGWFKNTPKFYRLSMMFNSIDVIPQNAFIHLIEKESRPNDFDFWLCDNVIREIHTDTFENIGKIHSLWLENNKLNENLFDAIGHIKINDLHLNGNRVKCLNDKLMNKLKITSLSIDDNPLDCSCLKSMKKIAKNRQIELKALRKGLECLKDRIKKLGGTTDAN